MSQLSLVLKKASSKLIQVLDQTTSIGFPYFARPWPGKEGLRVNLLLAQISVRTEILTDNNPLRRNLLAMSQFLVSIIDGAFLFNRYIAENGISGL